MPLHVYELGGGTGTLARDILNTLRDSHPSLYQSCRYRSIEISPRLGQLQHDRVCNLAGHSDTVFSVWSGDASVPSTWQQYHATDSKENTREEEGHCWIIATEVLDNLPHDCILPTTNDGDEYSSWNEVMVGPSSSSSAAAGGGELEEQYRPLGEDLLILECFKAWNQLTQPGSKRGTAATTTINKPGNILKSMWNAYANLLLNDDDNSNSSMMMPGQHQGERVFLPTGALQLLKTISTQRPNHTLVFIDFDQLPDVQMKGYNAPIICSTMDGEARDYGHYLFGVVPGTADIFFPTDFDLLSLLYKQSTNSSSSSSWHAKCSDFFSLWQPKSSLSSTKLLTGYNPMVQDYSNTAIFIGKSR